MAPYKVQLVQELKPTDHSMCFRFTKRACDQLREDADFAKNTSFQMMLILIVAGMKTSSRYCWCPIIDKSITELAAKCIQCQETSSSPRKEYSFWPSPDHPWQRIHLDFAGPFLGDIWLVCIDAFSKFPFVVKISTTMPSATISVLKGIFALKRLPDTIFSDNGRQFVSHEFERFCSSNGIQDLTSAPFDPASNGEAERFVRTFKTSLKKIMEGGEDLNNASLHHLSTFRSTPNPITGKSPAEILHGR
ncbi:uncharacterized protein K02A2.6-like [Eupeodes corollae]|uniref:uncharacterized protein K02A2.6-like n=1 Tax=Eupeodes corollae TaxID=290404 RepID=UPI00249314E4|nr:uncharacterized protein K02A2.6-like [Eupeodes corollae]